ncbi:unnamed protein product [Lota lota]
MYQDAGVAAVAEVGLQSDDFVRTLLFRHQHQHSYAILIQTNSWPAIQLVTIQKRRPGADTTPWTGSQPRLLLPAGLFCGRVS